MKRAFVLLVGLLLTGCITSKPHDFACGRHLEDHGDGQVMFRYPAVPTFEIIHRDAQGDFRRAEGEPSESMSIEPNSSVERDRERAVRMLTSAIDAGGPEMIGGIESADEYNAILILSGGGQWGAFGAGYLAEWNEQSQKGGATPELTLPARESPVGRPRFLTVTGISSGALQALFVASGEIDKIPEAYKIERQSDLAISRGLVGLLRRGALFDTEPLRQRIMSQLCSNASATGEGATACPMLRRIADSKTTLLIGMVDADTGDLQIVNVSRMLSRFYRDAEQRANNADAETEIASCVTGVAMASSAVPAQLRPVRIDGKAYLDGGVRSSAISDFVGTGARESTIKPEIYVVRNGPTVVPPAEASDDVPRKPKVSVDPNVLQIGLRSYSTIVNQNEVTSIALLHQIYQRPIWLATADGFNSLTTNSCPKFPFPSASETKDQAFNPSFMTNLTNWGRCKYREHDWIKVGEQSGPVNQSPTGGQ